MLARRAATRVVARAALDVMPCRRRARAPSPWRPRTRRRSASGPVELGEVPHLCQRVSLRRSDAARRLVRLAKLLVVRVLLLAAPGERVRHPGLTGSEEEEHRGDGGLRTPGSWPSALRTRRPSGSPGT